MRMEPETKPCYGIDHGSRPVRASGAGNAGSPGNAGEAVNAGSQAACEYGLRERISGRASDKAGFTSAHPGGAPVR